MTLLAAQHLSCHLCRALAQSSSLWVKPSQVLGENKSRLGIQDNFLYCYQKAFISTMALDTIPSSGLWRELTVGTGCSENRVSHGGDALNVTLLVRSYVNTKREGGSGCFVRGLWLIMTRSKPQAPRHLTQQGWEMCRENRALHNSRVTSDGENQALVRIHTECSTARKTWFQF